MSLVPNRTNHGGNKSSDSEFPRQRLRRSHVIALRTRALVTDQRPNHRSFDMSDKPRRRPGQRAEDRPNLGQKEAEQEKAERGESEEQDDRDDEEEPNLGQKEAEEE